MTASDIIAFFWGADEMAGKTYMPSFEFGLGILDYSYGAWEQGKKVTDKFAPAHKYHEARKDHDAFAAHCLSKCMEQQVKSPDKHADRRTTDPAREAPLVRQILEVLQFESHRTSVSKVFRSAR